MVQHQFTKLTCVSTCGFESRLLRQMIDTTNLEHHKVADIFIFNNKFELALQKRSSADKSFPDHWDFSAGGHIDSLEEPIQTAKREIYEEIGISGQLTFISQIQLQYRSWNSTMIRTVDASIYLMIHNGPFKIDPKEVSQIFFFKRSEIQKMIKSGQKFHPEFLLIWNNSDVMDEIESWLETLDILSSPEEMKALRSSLKDSKRIPLDDLKKSLGV